MNEAPDFDGMAVIDFSGGTINVPEEIILEQVQENILRGLPQVRPYSPNQQTAILVAGGPSLGDTEDELVRSVWRGGKVVTVNGSYNWCIERNIKPSAHVVLDAREFSARFVGDPVPDCNYFLASQVHPKAYEACRGRKVTIFHIVSTGDPELEILKKFYFDRISPVSIGTTVTLRAISLLRMLGFMRIEIFGFDSCVFDNDRHHAYEQKENDGEPIIPVWLRIEGRDDLAQRFSCTPWQAKQADDFKKLVEERGDLLQLKVHGPGLISTMLRLGAELDLT